MASDLSIFRKVHWKGLVGSAALGAVLIDPVFGPLIYGQLLLHEMGHAVALTKVWKRPLEKMTFTPLGGAVHFNDDNISESMLTQVSLAGPVTGILGGVFLASASHIVGTEYVSYTLMEAASLGFFLNATNLIPLRPADGGQVFSPFPSYYKLPPLCLASALFFSGADIMSPVFFSLYAGATAISIVRSNWTHF